MESYYLEDTTNQQFLKVSAQDDLLVFHRGTIDKPCFVYTIKSTNSALVWKNFESVKQRFIEKGYSEIEQTHELIKGSVVNVLRKPDIESHPIYKEILEFGEMQELANRERYVVAHCPNGIDYEGDLDFSLLAELIQFSGLVIEGDVNVTGVLSQINEVDFDSVLVIGNVTAKSYVKDYSHVRICGNLTVEQTAYADFNAGSLMVKGDAFGECWISDDQEMWAQGEYHLRRADVFNEGIPDWLNSEVLDVTFDEDNEQSIELNKDKMLAMIFAGKSVINNRL